MSSTPLWNILFFFMLVALALLWVSNCWAFAHRSHMVFDCGYVDCTNKIAKINKYIVQIVMWFLHCNCSVPIYYLSRKPNVIRLGYVFVVSLSKCRCVVSVCLIFQYIGYPIIWIHFMIQTKQWLIWFLFAGDFWSKLIHFLLSFFSFQPFRDRYLCFCFAKKPRETFLYKIDVLGLMGLIVDSFDVWWESGWLRE